MPDISAPSALRDKIRNAPEAPGCYLFSDRFGNVAYVGKSRLLRSRVRQYFGKTAREDERTKELIPRIADVEYRVTATELDALILEYQLIKRHKPWFNSQHKRDTPAFYVRIGHGPLPAITIEPDGEGGFGPFPDEYKAAEALELLGDVWGLPRCGKSAFDGKARPCLFHGLGRCMAPCAGLAQEKAYGAAIADAARLLLGETPQALEALESGMRACAAKMEFEKAAQLKERGEKVKCLQRVCGHRFAITAETDAVLFLRGEADTAFSAFAFARGMPAGRVDFDGGEGDASRLARLCAMALTQGNANEEDAWLCGCLTEIRAVKRFIRIDKGGDPLEAERRVHAGYREFLVAMDE